MINEIWDVLLFDFEVCSVPLKVTEAIKEMPFIKWGILIISELSLLWHIQFTVYELEELQIQLNCVTKFLLSG